MRLPTPLRPRVFGPQGLFPTPASPKAMGVAFNRLDVAQVADVNSRLSYSQIHKIARPSRVR